MNINVQYANGNTPLILAVQGNDDVSLGQRVVTFLLELTFNLILLCVRWNKKKLVSLTFS